MVARCCRSLSTSAPPSPASEDEGWTVVSQVDGTVRAIDPDHPEPDSWTAYVGGVIRVLRALRLAPAGARLAVASSVPIGAGLSSSAALTVATARALVGLTGRRIPPAALADIAYRAEHDEVGVRCGRMDQIVSAQARPGHAMLIETASGAITHVAVRPRGVADRHRHPPPADRWAVQSAPGGMRGRASAGARAGPWRGSPWWDRRERVGSARAARFRLRGV